MDPADLLWYSLAAVRWGIGAFAVLLLVATVLSETRFPHWPVRMWDFPRSQITICCVAIAVLWPILSLRGGWTWFDWTLPVLLLAAAGRQLHWIWPYLAATKHDLKRADEGVEADLTLIISNVLQQNDDYARWRKVIGEEDADVVACAETNERWIAEIGQLLDESHPHTVKIPQDNMYGMAIWSRIPLHDVNVRRIVQEDIPSVHLTLELHDGRRSSLHVLHPRPPAPQEGDSSAPRDAELVVVAREIANEETGDHLPTIVCGDLNDVAWSRTTELFQKVSGLLDPRKGRGLYNSFHAGHWWVRFPLDHVFVGREFLLVEMQRLDSVGSDHFPMLIRLALKPDEGLRRNEKDSLEDAEHEEAEEMVETQKDREAAGLENGHLRKNS